MSQQNYPAPHGDGGIRVKALNGGEISEIRQSSVRQTPDASFGTMLRRGAQHGANAVEQIASSVGYQVPGRAVVTAALTSAAAVRDASPEASPWSSSAPSGGLGSNAGGVTYLAERAEAGDSGARMALATQQMQQANFANSVALLNMQTSVQNEQRNFSVASNVSKTRHESMRNSIANLK